MKRKDQRTLLQFFNKKQHTDNQPENGNEQCCDKQADPDQQKEMSEPSSSHCVSDESSNIHLIEPLLATDISFFVNKSSLSDHEKLTVLNNCWEPDSNFKFPISISNKGQVHTRRFFHPWLEKNKWLAYSKTEDAAYCKVCVLFSPREVGMRSSQPAGNFVTKGFNNWKKATEKFKQHVSSQYHEDASERSRLFLDVMQGKIVSVDEAVDKGKAAQILKNRAILRSIIETVILCGRQNLPLRGHRDHGQLDLTSSHPDNEGNFKALLRFKVQAGDKVLEQHITSCAKNATYTSWNVQNQILDACNQIILKDIVEEVNAAKCFSILADETADISNTEQLTLCVRYLKRMEGNEFKVCEQFLQFFPIHETTGSAIANAILLGLADCNVNIDHLCGQGYDGAGAMSGVYNGAQSHIQSKYPKALYVHCASHNLNLAISNASEIQAIRNCFGVVKRIYGFFNFPKRQDVLKKHIGESNIENNKKTKLKNLCPTRWVERHNAVIVMVLFLDPIVQSLTEIQQWRDADTSTNAKILLHTVLQPDFVIPLLSAEKALSYTLPLSKKLQKEELDLHSAISSVENITTVIENVRQNAEEEFDKIFEESVNMLDKYGVTVKIPRITQRQVHRSNVATGTDAKDYYRVSVFIPWIDSFLSSLQNRFLKHKDVLKGFDCLLPKTPTPNKRDKEDILLLSARYLDNVLSGKCLLAEQEMWYARMNSLKISLSCKKMSPLEVLMNCEESSFPNVHKLLKVFATLPVTTSSSERSFSTLKRIKTYLRNTMSDNRLNGLAALNIHREVNVDVDAVIDYLASSNSRRLDFVL